MPGNQIKTALWAFREIRVINNQKQSVMVNKFANRETVEELKKLVNSDGCFSEVYYDDSNFGEKSKADMECYGVGPGCSVECGSIDMGVYSEFDNLFDRMVYRLAERAFWKIDEKYCSSYSTGMERALDRVSKLPVVLRIVKDGKEIMEKIGTFPLYPKFFSHYVGFPISEVLAMSFE